MMKLIVALLLGLIALATRKEGDGPLTRRYLPFILVGFGALAWAGTFDALGHGRDVAADTALYRRVILWSAAGVVTSLGGIIAAWWCRSRLLKVSSILIGAAAMVMCAINILLPY
jgi:hypothetical protein